MNADFFKQCEVCGKDIFVYKGVEHSIVPRDAIKVWHYDCRITSKVLPDDLAVRVFHCTGPFEGDYVFSYMTPEAVAHIDEIHPNSFNVEIASSIIRTPLAELETPPVKKMDFDDLFNRELTTWEKIYYGVRNLKEIPRKLKNRFITKPSVIQTSLNKYNYHDTVELLLYGNMDMFVKFYDAEIIDGVVAWDSDPEHRKAKKDMDDIYAWWKNYPAREKEIEDTLDLWFANKGKWSTKRVENKPDLSELIIPPANAVGERAFKLLQVLEDELEVETEEMLVKLVKLRIFLWT